MPAGHCAQLVVNGWGLRAGGGEGWEGGGGQGLRLERLEGSGVEVGEVEAAG